jgi:hypothetical protein
MLKKIKNLDFEFFQEVYVDWIRKERFNDPIESVRSLHHEYDRFSRYTNQQFEEICRAAYDEKFLPSINWFHEKGQEIVDREYREDSLYIAPSEITEEQRAANRAEMAVWVKKLQEKGRV